jgi:hypothetical protein
LIRRRAALAAIAATLAFALLVALPRPARAFGDKGAFDPRVLLAGGVTRPAHLTAPTRWAYELVQRTSAPAKLAPTTVRADDPAIVEAPFLYWSGDQGVSDLTAAEIAGLRRFFALGGLLVVDDAGVTPTSDTSSFGRTARQQIARVIPDESPIALGPEHVIFRSFYLLRRAEGRVLGPKTVDAIVRGGAVQVIFTQNDLGGALAKGPTGLWEAAVVPGGDAQREHAIRLAVNIAMYLLCSNYKDDQVHAPFLMRRRAMLPDSAPSTPTPR